MGGGGGVGSEGTVKEDYQKHCGGGWRRDNRVLVGNVEGGREMGSRSVKECF